MAPLLTQAVYEEIMLHRFAGDSSVMDNFEAPFEAAEGWVEEEATCQQSFTRCRGLSLARRVCVHMGILIFCRGCARRRMVYLWD